MKRILLRSILAIAIFVIIIITDNLAPNLVAAQTDSQQLYYTYYDRKIPLIVREDAIAVAFKNNDSTGQLSRSGTLNSTPLYLQLQQNLQKVEGSRNTANTNVEVKPLGQRYALIELPESARSIGAAIAQQAAQQPYVETTLAVVQRSDRNEYLVIPNEIVVSFDPKLSESEVKTILDRSNLKIIRSLRFTRNRYLVQTNSASGSAILGVANQLNQTQGIASATPNFIQSTAQQIAKPAETQSIASRLPALPQSITANLANMSVAGERSQSQQGLSWLQWYLDNRPVSTLFACASNGSASFEETMKCMQTPPKTELLPRSDLHATEAWQTSKRGSGVIVAVLDSIIQWDHPDLADSVYSVGNVADKLPNETHGWDFGGDDADTRISEIELALYQPMMKASFSLSDAELLQQYPELTSWYRSDYPGYSDAEIAGLIRNYIHDTVTGLFHGTMVSGVIAARSPDRSGLAGVAPNARILPVTVGTGSFDASAIIEGIGYAAARDADVINMSFAFFNFAPIQDMADAIAQVRQEHPDIVFVAAAGNQDAYEVNFPANADGVLSVGATGLTGNRAPYSNYGTQVDLTAPGGDLSLPEIEDVGGILTLGGTWVDAFWQGTPVPSEEWGSALDPKGKYVWTQGTSFSSPAVAGVIALMKGEDPQRQLSSDRIVDILKKTASLEPLSVSETELSLYNALRQDLKLPETIEPKQYFFGSGLVNAAAAVEGVRRAI